MICIISGNKLEAERFASGQLLEDDEWFYPMSEMDIMFRKDFHVLVVGTAGQNISPGYFEKILKLAKLRGRMK